MTNGTLNEGEFHPAATDAMKYILSLDNLAMHLEAFSSCALSGNRLADVCAETLRRVMMGDPVSDRYLLGLAWTLKGMEE